MAGTSFTREQSFGWEGQLFFYAWVLLGERPVLTVLDSQHDFPQYLAPNRRFPHDPWMLGPAFLVVGNLPTTPPALDMWHSGSIRSRSSRCGRCLPPRRTPKKILALTFKRNGRYQRHVTIGESAVELAPNEAPVTGTAFEASFCSILHHPKAIAAPQSITANSWARNRST